MLLREARRSKKLTQTHLAQRLRSTQKWISAIENGKESAEIGPVLRLARELGLTLACSGDGIIERYVNHALPPVPPVDVESLLSECGMEMGSDD
nr:helix-turn-helix domain-containing protein [Endobacter medicaginis]